MRYSGLHKLPLLLALLLLVPSGVAAQGYNNEGMPYRDCDVDSEWERDEELSTERVRSQDAALSGMTAAEAEELRQTLEAQQRDQVRQIDDLLANMRADHPNRATYLFRKATVIRDVQEAVYNAERLAFGECMDNWYSCASDDVCYEPSPSFDEPIAIYRDIARNHPNYNRLDEVFFRLGEGLILNGQSADGVETLSRLVNTYPNSQYLAEAYLMMGDHFFDNDLLIAARQNFDQVLRFPESGFYVNAMYNLAWVDLNENDFESMLTRLQQVVTTIDERADVRADFRRAALNDMVLAYAEVDQGWQRARQYYESNEGEETMRRQLGRLSNLLDEQGKDEERVALLAYLMDRYPLDPDQPRWAEESLSSYDNIGEWDRFETAARGYITYLHNTGEWWSANTGDDRVQRRARQLTEGTMLRIITRNFEEAERLTTMPERQLALYQQVGEDYVQFFELFPDSREIYDQRFFYAELLYYQLANGGRFDSSGLLTREEFDVYLRMAGEEYRVVVEMRPDPEAEHAHDAAVGALQVYDDFMVREVPDVDAPIPPPNEFEFGEREELGPAAQGYVEIVAWFANIFPEDDRIPAASWRAASLFLRANQVAEAAERFETIIEHHAEHRFAFDAALAAFVCYDHVQNWERIESVARRLLATCEGRASADCEAERFEQAIAYAMNNQAEDLVTEGRRLALEDRESDAQALFLQAAQMRLALFNEFPESEWSPDALFNAAATFESARQVQDSIRYYELYVAEYPEHGRIADARYVLGLIYDSQAEFATAAQWFESLDDYEDFESRNDAIFLAARLREALSDFDEAVVLYERVLELEGDSSDAQQILFLLADLEDERGNLDASFARLQQFRDTFPEERALALAALGRQADIRERQERMDDAVTLHSAYLDAFGRGQPALDEDGNWAGSWQVPPGRNFEDEDERRRLIPAAARARFVEAQPAVEEALEAQLVHGSGIEALAQSLVRRAELHEAAMNQLTEVVETGDAAWAIAAFVRMGDVFYDFYSKVENSPEPDFMRFDLDECLDSARSHAQEDRCYDMEDQIPDMIEAWEERLFEFREPFYRGAMAALERAYDEAQRNGIFTEWSVAAVERLNRIEPQNFQLGGEQGVVANATSDLFIRTNLILDLTEKQRAFADFTPPEMFEGMPGMEDSSAPAPAPTPAPAPAETSDTESESTEEAAE